MRNRPTVYVVTAVAAAFLLAAIGVWYFARTSTAQLATTTVENPPGLSEAEPAAATAPIAAATEQSPLAPLTADPARSQVQPATSPVAAPPSAAVVFTGVEPDQSKAPDEEAAAAEPEAPAPVDEIVATQRMYMAHAPLRTPEVADPDSASNKQILQTMVQKALAHPAGPPPATMIPIQR